MMEANVFGIKAIAFDEQEEREILRNRKSSTTKESNEHLTIIRKYMGIIDSTKNKNQTDADSLVYNNYQSIKRIYDEMSQNQKVPTTELMERVRVLFTETLNCKECSQEERDNYLKFMKKGELRSED